MTNEIIMSSNELIIMFLTIISIIISICLYLSREYIFQRKTDYDKKYYKSKLNNDYEKYYSKWTDDTNNLLNKKNIHKIYNTNNNYYKIFGISKFATSDEIKLKYKNLVKKWHPDKNNNSKTAEQMIRINKAYEVLSNTRLRNEYDAYLDDNNNNLKSSN